MEIWRRRGGEGERGKLGREDGEMEKERERWICLN